MLALDKKRFASVTRYIRKLRGGSQPILVGASDGNVYVLKFGENLQGAQLPFNESMGTELYRTCGMPVPSWVPLVITDSFLDRNPSCWPETPHERYRPAPGICFGSRFLGGEEGRLYEVLPGAYFPRVVNAFDFWIAWLLDICADHADNRQALFCERSGGQLHSVFIDFGHMFGGADGRRSFPPLIGSRYMDPRIYPRTGKRFQMTILKSIANLDSEHLIRQATAIPDEWKSESAIQNLNRCLDRLANAEYLLKTLNTIASSRGTTANKELLPCYG